MVEYMTHIKRPFQDLKTLGIGFLIGLIPILGGIVVSGFGLLSADNFLKGNNTLAKWDFNAAVDMIVKAIMAFIVSLIYLIPAGILMFIALGSIIFAGLLQSGSSDPSALLGGLAGMGLFGILALLLLVLAVFLLPMAIMNMLKNGFGAAFRFKTVSKKAFTSKYIVTFIVSIVYSMVLAVLVTIVSAALITIPVVGTMIGASFASIISAMTIMPMYAETYNEIQQV